MERRQPFISRVRLRNYKSIASCDVRLGPLTILIGPNGSGKSNFLDALAFLGRAVETTPNQAIRERGGLAAIIRSGPPPTDSLEIQVEVSLPRDGDWAHGTYGFKVKDKPREGTFEIYDETCELVTPDQTLRFEVRDGFAHDYVRKLPRTLQPKVEPDRLYLQSASVITPGYALLSRHLGNMRFYSLSNEVLREAQPAIARPILGNRGEQLSSVLATLAVLKPRHKERLVDYLQAIVPGVTGIDHLDVGPYLTIRFTMSTGVDGQDIAFTTQGMSDGTIRAIGVLAALFQSSVLDETVPLVGIEEPEIALHPAAAGVLFDALTEASDRVQVIATSQSPDLLDRDDLDVDIVRAVAMENGITAIGEVDNASRRSVQERLYTVGELMRGNQITPSDPAAQSEE
jgi:predicted ATPase